MSFISNSQVIIEDGHDGQYDHIDHNMQDNVEIPDDNEVVLYDGKPSKELVLEIHDSDSDGQCEPEELKLDNIPGAPEDAQDDLVIEDNTVEIDEDKNKLSSPEDRWDAGKHPDIKVWFRDIIDHVPTHSGYDELGLERTIAYFERADQEFTRAVRSDFDGKIDANFMEEVRNKIDDAIVRLKERLDDVKVKKGKKKKKKADITNGAMVKEGQKSTPINGIVISVSAIVSLVARACINGSVSGGHDINVIFNHMIKKFALTEREQAETMQLLSDMGFNFPGYDRGYLPDEKFDKASSDNFDLSAEYQA